MSTGAVKSEREKEREHERATQEHEAKMQRQILDWIAVVQPKRGDVLVMTVPSEYFTMPGTPMEEITEEQKSMMETAYSVFKALLDGCREAGILMLGACVLGEGMSLADVPPPWEKHPDSRDPSEHVVVPGKKLYLPHGTKI